MGEELNWCKITKPPKEQFTRNQIALYVQLKDKPCSQATPKLVSERDYIRLYFAHAHTFSVPILRSETDRVSVSKLWWQQSVVLYRA